MVWSRDFEVCRRRLCWSPHDPPRRVDKSYAKVYQAAAGKELGAAQAHNGLIKLFKDPNLAATSGFLGGDEAAHYAAIRTARLALLSDSNVNGGTVLSSAFFTKKS